MHVDDIFVSVRYEVGNGANSQCL